MEYKIIKEANINKDLMTGETVHKLGDIVIKAPSKLQIVQYIDELGFYLLYLNSNNEELSDTYHDKLQNAMDQAKWEFGLENYDWENKL